MIWSRVGEPPREERRRAFVHVLLAGAFISYLGAMTFMNRPGMESRKAFSKLEDRLGETVGGSFTVNKKKVCIAECRNPLHGFNFNKNMLVADFSKGNHFEEYVYDLELKLLEVGVGDGRERWFNRYGEGGHMLVVVRASNYGDGWFITGTYRGERGLGGWKGAVEKFGLTKGAEKLLDSGSSF